MPGFKQTEIGAIPEDWEVKTVNAVADVTSGGNAPQGGEYFENGTYPFVRVQHFAGDKEYVEKWDLINTKAIDKYRLKLFPKNAIVFPKSGASIRLEKRAKLPFEMCVVSHLCVLIPKNISTDFLFYYLKSIKLGIASAGSTLPFLNISAIGKKLVPCPTELEQNNISNILSKIQSAIESQEKIIKTATELKKALMQRLFTKGLYGGKQKEAEVGLAPISWEIVPLEQTGEVVYGIQAAVANLTKPIGTKILTNINITFDGEIDLTKLRYFPLTKPRHLKTLLRKGDILFNWRSGSKKHVGKTAFFDLEGDFTHSSFILRIRTNDKVLNKYMFYYLTYLRSSGYFLKLQNYSVNAKFNASAVNALTTLVPSYEEQTEIAKSLDAIDVKIKCATKILNSLKNLFNSMLHHLMTGQIRVKDLDIEVLGRN